MDEPTKKLLSDFAIGASLFFIGLAIGLGQKPEPQEFKTEYGVTVLTEDGPPEIMSQLFAPAPGGFYAEFDLPKKSKWVRVSAYTDYRPVTVLEDEVEMQTPTPEEGLR